MYNKFQDLDGTLSGQNLITGTHDGSLYANSNGVKYNKSGSISGIVYKFSNGDYLDCGSVIKTHGKYTLTFLLYVPPVEGSLLTSRQIKAKFSGKLIDQSEVSIETGTVFNTRSDSFKLVKFIIDTEMNELPLPINISIYSQDNIDFVISDLKLEMGVIYTPWCKSIDDLKLDIISEEILKKPKSGTLIIPIDGWEDNTDDYYKKKISVDLIGSTTQHVLMGTVLVDSEIDASSCGLADKANTENDGYVTFYANSVPTNPIKIKYVLLESKPDKNASGTIVIPTTGWVDNTDDTYIKKKITVEVEAVQDTDFIVGSVVFDSSEEANKCGLLNSIETGNGTVTFYANSVPTSEIYLNYTLIESKEEE